MGGTASDVLEQVRACLDNDLDTPGAVAAMDAAAAQGHDVSAPASLLGVELDIAIGPK
jgi:L-cysteine:1D-myo-inositol 2-amino-2-deoxy-alpha-D-glucopyranoside ligase